MDKGPTVSTMGSSAESVNVMLSKERLKACWTILRRAGDSEVQSTKGERET
jgi:hypothetical protein